MEQSFKLAGEVVQSFISVNRALTRFSQQNAASLGLTLPQMGMLNAIYAKMGSTLKEIAERLQMPKSTASVVLDGLVNMDLAERREAQDDRREIRLNVTEKGEELARKSIGNSTSYRAMQNALGRLAQGDVQTLLRIHREMEEYLLENKS